MFLALGSVLLFSKCFSLQISYFVFQTLLCFLFSKQFSRKTKQNSEMFSYSCFFFNFEVFLLSKAKLLQHLDGHIFFFLHVKFLPRCKGQWSRKVDQKVTKSINNMKKKIKYAEKFSHLLNFLCFLEFSHSPIVTNDNMYFQKVNESKSTPPPEAM